MAKSNNEHQGAIEEVESVLSKTEQYIEENQKSLTIILAVIFVLFGGYYGYKKLYLAPKEKEAREQMFVAENYFETDSFRLAIVGDGNNYGFEDIADEYGLTKSANLANYYIGISNLRKGDYDAAIDALKDFDANDEIVAAISLGAIGDAYSEMQDYDKAIDYYKQASAYSDNQFSAPVYLMKLGILYENQQDFNKALEAYEKIQQNYAGSSEGRNIEKYITRVNLKIKG
jgi:tetratricopeptide (TPR) repeat protein